MCLVLSDIGCRDLDESVGGYSASCLRVRIRLNWRRARPIRGIHLRPDGLEHGEMPAAGRWPQSLVLEDRSEGLAGAVVGECVPPGRVLVAYLERRSHVDSCLGK